MKFYNYLNEETLNPVKIEIIIPRKESAEKLYNLIDYIKNIGNVGHSFSIIVDPDSSEKEEFDWDGDGIDYIKSVKIKE